MSKRPIKEIPAETIAQTRKATDPLASVWVSANAGSGKTHVLSERVIRLLLEGVEPSTIVCLTYTKAAASVMENRVFQRLAEWTGLSDEELAEAISKLDGGEPEAAKLVKARRLFARALETPGGLKIQTIHAFCQMILGRFPLEANIAGRFDLVDDALLAQIIKDARRAVLQKAGIPGADAIAQSVRQIVGALGEKALTDLLEDVLKSRDRPALAEFCRSVAEGGAGHARLYDFLGCDPTESEADIISRSWPLNSLPVAVLRDMVALKPDIASKVHTLAFVLCMENALSAPDAALRHKALKAAVKDEGGVKNKDNVARALSAFIPDISATLDAFGEEMAEIADHLTRLKTARFTVFGLTLANSALSEYAERKAKRALLDYDDIIERTVKLLTQSGASAWVQYKLDQGISHILVDEAQDTSPSQWKVINALSEEFFAGETARGQTRTLFAVGDEKQSIYSFQGARPEVFAETGRQTKAKARAADKRFEPASLNLSFRSTADVLAAVDQVFAVPENQRGLVAGGEYQLHQPIRIHGPGRVEIWPCVIPPEKEEVPDNWTQGQRHEAAPPARLAASIAKTIDDWLKNGAVNQASGAKIMPRDIMVLVRKRGPFVNALSRELKNRRIAASGADRLTLTDHIAVKDLLALARICLLTEDDLSLAALLRSPLFAFSDEELMNLAAYRAPGESLYDKMRNRAANDQKAADAFMTLERWRKEASESAVFDFFARVLSRDRVRARLMQRLGVEAGEIIDEFLNYAAETEKAGLGGLQDFVETLEEAAPEVKREMDAARNEVRIMTAHAAKGQESPIVFLVDPPPQNNPLPRLLALSAEPPLFVWEPLKEFHTSKTAAHRTELKSRGEEEFRRLLYVGMTRAEDRLIVCGFANSKTIKREDTWLRMVSAGLKAIPDHIRSEWQPHLEVNVDIFQLLNHKPPPAVELGDSADSFAPLPHFFSQPLPPVRLVPRPLSPSGASLVIEPGASASAASPVLDNNEAQPSVAILRGLITHKLLESLPGLPQESRRLAALRYVDKAAADWTDIRKAAVVADVLRVLEDTRFQPAFSAGSRAEVSVVGQVRVRGETRMVSGKIDRIAVEESRILLVDFKTDYAPAHSLADVPASYLTQMALYRAILQPLYPDKVIECALLYTGGAKLVALPSERMDAALEALANS